MKFFNDAPWNPSALFQIIGAPYASRGNDFPSITGPGFIRFRSYDMREITFFTTLGYQRDMARLDVADAGDCYANDAANIRDVVRNRVQHGHVPIVIGGDDEVSYHVARAAQQATRRQVRVIHFDAHLDLERGRLYHGSWARWTAERPWCDRFEVWGARGAVFTDTVNHGLKNVQLVPMTALARKNSIQTILCVDMDVFDPADAPGVGYRVPFGAPAWQIMESIERACLSSNIIAVAVTEYNPDRDSNFLTADLVVSVINHIIVSVNSRRSR